jgi:hypothetical protein
MGYDLQLMAVQFLLKFPTLAHVRSLSCSQFVEGALGHRRRKVN